MVVQLVFLLDRQVQSQRSPEGDWHGQGEELASVWPPGADGVSSLLSPR
jgi:hypothetical protein